MTAAIDKHSQARTDWDLRQRQTIRSERRWRWIAIGAMLVAIATSTSTAIQLRSPHFRTMIVAVDSVGRAVAAGTAAADEITVVDDRMKRAAINGWITHWRTVTTDKLVQRKEINAAYAMVNENSPAMERLNGFYDQDRGGVNPLERGRRETVEVQVESSLPTSPDSYEAKWLEVVRGIDGKEISRHRYTCSMTLIVEKVKDEIQALANPLGIYITNLSWSQIVEPK